MTRLRQEASPGAAIHPIRDFDGRFTTRAPVRPRVTREQAKAIYQTYLAVVCAHQGLKPREVERQLARPGKPNCDMGWRAAVYARQLALYLANTGHEIPQKMLADVVGLTPAAVCLALQAIEDLRDNSAFDVRVDAVAAVMRAP